MSDIQFPLDLDKLIDLLRKKGIESFKYEGLEFTLREEAPPSTYKRKKLESSSFSSEKTEPLLTEEDFLLWSVREEEIVGNG